jgi:hypothetical protein
MREDVARDDDARATMRERNIREERTMKEDNARDNDR